MNNKGITLMALIITIIIMLILISVTVKISFDSNLFKESQEVIFKQSIRELEEQIYAPSYISKYTNEKIDYEKFIEDDLKSYISVLEDGTLVYVGDLKRQEAKWAKEEGILGEQEYILKSNLEELVDLSKKYVATGNSRENTNLLVLQYIRRNRYTGGNWDNFAGEVDAGFVKYVDENKSKSLDMTNFIDPVTGEEIDFVHSMASFNVYLKRIDNNDILIEYACWAGDLCTFTEEIYSYYKSKQCTDEELKEYTKSKLGGNSTFGTADILADMDAIGIKLLAKAGNNHIETEEVADIDDLIYNYYYGENSENCAKRYSNFVSYAAKIRRIMNTPKKAAMEVLGQYNSTYTPQFAARLIKSYDEIPAIVFETVATCFGEYINERI